MNTHERPDDQEFPTEFESFPKRCRRLRNLRTQLIYAQQIRYTDKEAVQIVSDHLETYVRASLLFTKPPSKLSPQLSDTFVDLQRLCFKVEKLLDIGRVVIIPAQGGRHHEQN